MTKKINLIIIGATSAIAEQCARIWLRQPVAKLYLLGRDLHRLERVAADLRVRNATADILPVKTDFHAADQIDATISAIFSETAIDIVLIAHGSLPDQPECQQNLPICNDALQINGVSPVLFAEACARQMEAVGHGKIAMIGSVAGDRGRKSNYVYGAAKGLVDRYAQGLQHRFAGTAVQITLIKPGPTDTPMTAHLKSGGARLASPEAVAAQIVDGVAAGKRQIYTPGKWALIMLIIRHLPAFVFNKLNI